MRKLKNLGFLSSTEGIDPGFDFSMDGSIIGNTEVENFFALSEEDKQRIIAESSQDDALFELESFPEPISVSLAIKKNMEDIKPNMEYIKPNIEENVIKKENIENIKENKYIIINNCKKEPIFKLAILGAFVLLLFGLNKKEGG